MNPTSKCSPQVRERAARMAQEPRGELTYPLRQPYHGERAEVRRAQTAPGVKRHEDLTP